MQRFSNILFVAEPGVDNQAAFSQALTIADNNQARITVLGIVPVLNMEKAQQISLDHLMEKLVGQKLEELQALLPGAAVGGIQVEIKVLTGRPHIEIIREVLRHQHDLLVKAATNSTGFEHKLFGSLDRKLLRKCPCPVWLIKPGEQKGYQEILVGLEYEPGNAENAALNQQLLDMASTLALADGSDLHILHAWDVPYESLLRSPRTDISDTEVDKLILEEESKRRKWLDDCVAAHFRAQGMDAANYLKTVLALTRGDARKELPKYATENGMELVVMGTVSRTGIPGLIIGNTAEAIIDQINCSILAVKPSDFVSPVTLED